MKKHTIYLSILSFIIILLISLPLIKVPISTSSRGIINSEIENSPIKSIIGGKIISNTIKKNNQLVNQGDTLVIIKSDNLVGQLDILNNQIKDYLEIKEDLNKIQKNKINKLNTDLYIKDYTSYMDNYEQILNDFKLSEEEYKRAKILYDKGVYSKSEYEKYYYRNEGLKKQLETLTGNKNAEWASSKRSIEREILNLEKEKDRLAKEQNNYIITAPISGRIIDYSGVNENTYLIQGEMIAIISPENKLIVENYVSPKDIGFIKINQKCKYQIDTYNYNQWGTLDGEVIEIDKNITIDKQTGEMYFRVLSKMNRNYLELKNKYKGNIEKGMTLNTRFYLTDRTLWQLLFDRIDDWFNPNLK